MENENSAQYDTDLDDQETETTASSRLPFDRKLALHRSNRLNQTFGLLNIPSEHQINLEKVYHDDTLVPLSRETLSTDDRVEIYEESCRMLDITADRQLRYLLTTDHIVLIDQVLSFNEIRAFATAIGVNLRSLILRCVGLTSRSIRILCLALDKCVQLNLLDLSENKLGQHGFYALATTVDYLPSLLYLFLIGCGIRDACGLLVGNLCQHTKLKEINLSGNELEERACIAMGNSLKANTSLLCLNLSWNHIRTSASVALFRGLEVNKALTDLDLSWNGLSYNGSVALRRTLHINKTLQRLHASNCHIDWVNAKLISEGLAKNTTLRVLDLAFNPLTTHGVEFLMQAMTVKTSGLTLLDVSGTAVFSTSARLAEKIGQSREFCLKYDGEIPVHDIVGQPKVTKADSMRKVIQHLDQRHWRTLEYFRMLDKRAQLQLDRKTIASDILKSGMQLEHEDIRNIHRRLTENKSQPLTYKHLNTLINEQRLRDRSLKVREEEQARHRKQHNQRILQTVTPHFPEIEIVTRRQKHRQAIEKLAKPRASSARPKL